MSCSAMPITVTLNGILISTYDGDLGALKSLIETPTAEEFVRSAALEAMACLTRAGRVTDAEMRAYLLHLRAEMRPRAPSYLWSAWAIAAANLGYRDHASEVVRLIERGWIAPQDMSLANFDWQLRLTLSDPDGLAGFEFDQIRPLSDTIGTLSTWAGFSEQATGDQDELADSDRLIDAMALSMYASKPRVNPQRHVGRNDPCPCGSGRKYKKCCVH